MLAQLPVDIVIGKMLIMGTVFHVSGRVLLPQLYAMKLQQVVHIVTPKGLPQWWLTKAWKRQSLYIAINLDQQLNVPSEAHAGISSPQFWEEEIFLLPCGTRTSRSTIKHFSHLATEQPLA